ncbi:Glycine betaine ABC transport system, ATP-binding protein OpuAA [Halanaerobium saccharolyticum subsp. saccharolyticum DSM 6643]|uniref:Glycine betaine ABC transport system, ATP-binding protein OpuAA n=1 Tax=Halanaerobium saccharolyticum subsp. saccharolyticum DSM 6643 TaxID=1293054 RepID=M5E3F1_9FIRM|nr:hypothetical protein [Halanaerobium saccharolyticum]CCU81139.1 Glycine betaine ABC transport system, ATP-binding protein OpuAA [Halanaerobium saccharolyticum subsp. saccharolyticum DSM 6643]
MEAINKDKNDLDDIIKEVPIAEPEESVNDLFSKIADINTPLPVLDDKQKLKGVIVKTNVVANLAAEKV